QKFADAHKLKDIDVEALRKHGLASKRERVKILGRGELKEALNIKAHAFSATAKAAIEGKGGTTAIISK
ncbi:MAG: mitochondrial large ribosomal subunit protein uL15m, partial [Bacteroidia bacterium]|nr:mitochondrial large ribosomal subunit protein uL15m [Bacteroidia bacterium]